MWGDHKDVLCTCLRRKKDDWLKTRRPRVNIKYVHRTAGRTLINH